MEKRMYWKKLLNWPKTAEKSKKILIEGKKINLRSKKVEDAELDYKWRVDPELSALDATVPINISLREFRDHLKDEIKYPVPWSVKFGIENKDGVLIGNIMYYDIDPVDKEAEVGIIIGDRDFQGKGYGSDAMVTLKNYIFQETNLENLYLHTLITNERARKSFKKAGFSEIGEVRKDGMNFIKMNYKKLKETV